MDNQPDSVETRQERRDKKRRKKRERVRKHSKGLASIYRNAILKRLKRRR